MSNYKWLSCYWCVCVWPSNRRDIADLRGVCFSSSGPCKHCGCPIGLFECPHNTPSIELTGISTNIVLHRSKQTARKSFWMRCTTVLKRPPVPQLRLMGAPILPIAMKTVGCCCTVARCTFRLRISMPSRAEAGSCLPVAPSTSVPAMMGERSSSRQSRMRRSSTRLALSPSRLPSQPRRSSSC